MCHIARLSCPQAVLQLDPMQPINQLQDVDTWHDRLLLMAAGGADYCCNEIDAVHVQIKLPL